MNYTALPLSDKIATQADAITGIKNQNYIVGSVSADGQFSVAIAPEPFTTLPEARKSAKELGELTPGRLYVIMGLQGGEMIPNNAISI